MLEVQIVSRETIKPSSPTPQNLRHMQLSWIDQLAPPVHIPLILFYPAAATDDDSIGKTIRLKQSLSEVLVRFYPLAGRIKHEASGRIHVECNDQGAEFYEARARGKLGGHLHHPFIQESDRFLPPLPSKDVPLLLQFTVFDCGGSAIGISMSHRVGDGVSLAMFVQSFANATLKGGDDVIPRFGFASIFPPRSIKMEMDGLTAWREKVVAKVMVFEGPKIGIMREKVNARAGWSPTRVEAVSALIWRCIMRTRDGADLEKRPMVLQVVNIRGRMNPPLPEYSFGNLITAAIAIGDRVADDRESDRVGHLEGLLREASGKIKGDYVREMFESFGDSYDKEWVKGGVDRCVFTSCCGFPFYEVDFGWGKPEWLSLVTDPIRNSVMLVDTKNREGIEAWVFMEEGEMSRFENDPELLSFASFYM